MIYPRKSVVHGANIIMHVDPFTYISDRPKKEGDGGMDNYQQGDTFFLMIHKSV